MRYGADSVLVHERVAHALLDMAAVMARADDAQIVEFPILHEGIIERFEVVVGPSSHLSVHQGPPGEGPEGLLDEAAIERIRSHIRKDEPGPIQPQAVLPGDTLQFEGDF